MEARLLDAGTVGDVVGSLRAVAVFAPLLIAPGYLVGSVGQLAGWERLRARERLLWSIALSVCIVPLCGTYLLKYLHWTGLFAALAVCWAAAAWRFARERRTDGADRARGLGLWWTLALLWTLFAIGELVDVGVPGHLYLSTTVYDHALRTAFVDAVMRTGAPPANPLFWPGHPAAMRYYYFWYVVTAAVAKLGHTSARQALIASVVWAGFALAASIGLYGRWFLPQGPRRTNGLSRTMLGVALLGVGGLDVLPALGKLLAGAPADPDMDWWAADQVTTWQGSLLWVPHHVTALVCCVTGFLLVWVSRREEHRLRYAVVAGVAFASAFGLSTWVAVGFAFTFGAWVVWAWWWDAQARQRVKLLMIAGLTASLLLLPYLEELLNEPSGVVTMADGGADRQVSPGRMMRFGVRRMIDGDGLKALPGFALLAETHPRIEEGVAGLLLLVPGYFAELGFWSVVLWAALRARRLSEAERTGRALLVAGLIVTTFLRSTVITNNDFGMRSALVMQFFLLLFGVRWMEDGLGEKRAGVRRFAWALVAIGVAGTVYQAGLLRLYLPVQERLGNREAAGLSERSAALRVALQQADARMDRDAVMQFDPEQPSDYFRYAQILLAGRQIALALPVCPVGFGGDPRDCAGVESGAAALFAVKRESGGTVEGVLGAPEARALCSGMGVTTLVATRWDGVWQDRRGWVWNLPKVVESGDVRVLNCRQ